MKSSLIRYKIGLLVLVVFSLLLVIIVVTQASATKQDSDTFKTANGIADKLNNYITTANTVPTSLTAAGVQQVPGTISYQKLSDASYQFCINYKTSTTNFSASTVETNLLTSAIGGSSYSSPSSGSNSQLYLDGTYHKGQNCQIVKPLLTFSSSSSSNNASDPFAKCNIIQDTTAWQLCISNATTSQSSKNTVFTH